MITNLTSQLFGDFQLDDYLSRHTRIIWSSFEHSWTADRPKKQFTKSTMNCLQWHTHGLLVYWCSYWVLVKVFLAICVCENQLLSNLVTCDQACKNQSCKYAKSAYVIFSLCHDNLWVVILTIKSNFLSLVQK